MAGWKCALINMKGKFQHAKASLQNIPVSMESIFKIPTLVAKKLDQIYKNFIWVGTEQKKWMSLVVWEMVYRNK